MRFWLLNVVSHVTFNIFRMYMLLYILGLVIDVSLWFSFDYQNSDEFLSTKFDELLTLMIEVLPLCHFSAKRHRLDCLYFLIVQVTKVSIVAILYFFFL